MAIVENECCYNMDEVMRYIETIDDCRKPDREMGDKQQIPGMDCKDIVFMNLIPLIAF